MYKLLLADDESIIRQGIAGMVDWHSLNVSLSASCPDAFSALESMTDDMPDLLLTDVRMPGMSGLELVERALLMNPMLEAIILSGYEEFDYARQAMKNGVKEYLVKPCTKEEIEQAIRRGCREVDKRREKALLLSGEREDQVRRLMARLNELIGGSLGAEGIERQLAELEKTVQDISVLRDALFGILTGGVNASQAEWAFAMIQDVLRAGDKPLPVMAGCLLKLRGEGKEPRGFVQQMTDYVNTNYMNEALSLQYIADHVLYRNADYIGRVFSHAMGQKFSMYLLKVRMEHAKDLMASRADLRGYEIAEQVGMGANPHYFSQMFRKYTGLTTKEFRARMDGLSEK